MTMQAPDLSLIDIHEPPAPAWWPPAPGWWIVAGIVLLLVGFLCWRRWRKRWLRRRAMRAFDDAVAGASTPVERIAAISELLRRASRRRDPAAAALHGDDWLRFLDEGMPAPAFSAGPGRALLDGAFRRDAGDADVDALRDLARARFLDWVAPR